MIANVGIARMARVVAAGALAVGLGASLAGCAALLPDMGSYLETVPEVIEQSDLGVTRVTASSSPDGFGRNAYVGVHLDRATVTSTIDSESACEAIGSPSIRCDYNTTSIDLDDLGREFGA